MHESSVSRIWMNTAIVLLHGWAAIEIIVWAPVLRAAALWLFAESDQLSSIIVPKLDPMDLAGLLTFIAVVSADVWTLATFWQRHHGPLVETRREAGQGAAVSRPGRSGFIAVLGFLVLLVALVFGVTPSTKVFTSLCAVTAASLGSAMLLMFRVDAGNRVRARLDSAQKHLDSAAEHLKAIDAIRRRSSTGG